MRAPWAMTLLALLFAGGPEAAASTDRLDQFKALAQRYADAPDADAAAPLLAELFAVVDSEVIDNLQSGGLFASADFIQERVKAFSEEWGGVAFAVSPPGRSGAGGPALGLFAVTRGEPRGSLRIYGRSNGAVSLLASSTHDGTLEVRPWPPGRDGAAQFLASWIGSPGGRGSRTLLLELWREGDGATRVWSSAETFPGGLRTTGFAVKNGELRLRYEVTYPGWKPGCADETLQEDLYHQTADGGRVVLAHRRTLNGWHRELHAAVGRLFDALSASDAERLEELVPDAAVRARLPRSLEPEAVCDERAPGGSGAVIVAATQKRAQQRVPWSLSWRRSPAGWRLTAASPVLQ